ncbi:MAG: DNA polymerase III subunit epsilon [Casimicrobium sp.]
MEVLERLVFLDTETTGLDPRLGHRIIEVAAVEAIGRELTGNQLHSYLDPEREIDAGATAVHGLSWEDLRDKPKFATIAGDLLKFMSGARVIIHNAAFDVSFIDHELARLRQPPIAKQAMTITDSLLLAREKFPGKRNSLDALCDRLGVNNAHRNLHGALLDARLLAEVYFALTRGQGTLEIDVQEVPRVFEKSFVTVDPSALPLPVAEVGVTALALNTHVEYMARLAKQSGVKRIMH